MAAERILVAHNYYQQPGGEDQIFAAETALLEEHGHHVVRYTVHNEQIQGARALAAAGTALWNPTTYRELRTLLRRERIQLAHFHNTFPLISPAAYYAARAEGVPVVQSLHNYRLLCPSANFFRQGRLCEDCLGKLIPWPGVQHACYRASRPASASVAALLTVHRLARTWSGLVDIYIAALSEFGRQKFMQGGLPADRILTKPNFVAPDPGPGPGAGDARGRYALFVGRLAPEKGIGTLLAAWQHLAQSGEPHLPLKIVGDGPLAPQVGAAAAQDGIAIAWLGRQPPAEVYRLMGQASLLVFPSEWYEGMPRTIIESFASGTPVVAASLGAMRAMVRHGSTGLHFRPGDAQDLAARIAWAGAHRQRLDQMRQATRAEYTAHYTATQNYQRLQEVYAAAARHAQQRHA